MEAIMDKALMIEGVLVLVILIWRLPDIIRAWKEDR